MSLGSIDLSDKHIPVVDLLLGAGKFINHQVAYHFQFVDLVFSIFFYD